MPISKEIHTIRSTKRYWDQFYRDFSELKESSFCRFIKKILEQDSIIIDIGCGNGRDSFSFAKAGFEVIGIDQSKQAITNNNSLLGSIINEDRKLQFQVIDVSNEILFDEFIAKMAQMAQESNKHLVAYMRFFLHAINEEVEDILFSTLTKYLRPNDMIAAEFRTIEDKDRQKIYGDHYRRYIEAEQLLKDLQEKYRLKQIFFTKGTGLAVYKGEDPYVARIVLKKTDEVINIGES